MSRANSADHTRRPFRYSLSCSRTSTWAGSGGVSSSSENGASGEHLGCRAFAVGGLQPLGKVTRDSPYGMQRHELNEALYVSVSEGPAF